MSMLPESLVDQDVLEEVGHNSGSMVFACVRT